MAVARSGVPTTRARTLEFERKAFYAPTEIAKILGISTQTVLDRIHDGSLYGVRISPRIYRVPLAALMQFLGEPRRVKRRVWRTKDAERFWARLEHQPAEHVVRPMSHRRRERHVLPRTRVDRSE